MSDDKKPAPDDGPRGSWRDPWPSTTGQPMHVLISDAMNRRPTVIDNPPCAIEPPNCCVKTIGFLSPCPKCGHMRCHGRYLEWEAERGIVRPHPGCAGIHECCCLNRHDPWSPDPSYPDGVAYVMRVGPLRCRVSNARNGDWEWSVTVEADHETAWISSGFAVGKDAAMGRAEQAIKLIADGVVRALSSSRATP